ncbi:MAG: hypothetical protein Q7T89_01120 [Anaerolineales bacterium]|nr:hypothetical protein [Anaerolineales bacterium]
MKALNILISFAGALGIYAAWYRIYVGDWCPAMWFGSAPLLIILISTIFLMRVLNAFNKDAG